MATEMGTHLQTCQLRLGGATKGFTCPTEQTEQPGGGVAAGSLIGPGVAQQAASRIAHVADWMQA